QIQ
ncbi:DNA photolyase family protein, partial [Vibrio parahaemolyticus V-223/04]